MSLGDHLHMEAKLVLDVALEPVAVRASAAFVEARGRGSGSNRCIAVREVAKYERDGVGDALPALGLELQLLFAERGEAVVLRATVVLGGCPIRRRRSPRPRGDAGPG
jgi:hypothetical protein